MRPHRPTRGNWGQLSGVNSLETAAPQNDAAGATIPSAVPIYKRSAAARGALQ